jgi:hypothetical protein
VGPRTGLDDVEKRKILPYRESKADPSAVRAADNRFADCAILLLDRMISELERIWQKDVVVQFEVLSIFSWKDRGKPLKTSVKIVGVPAGISKIRGRSVVAERDGKVQDSERSDKKHFPNCAFLGVICH